MKNKQLRALLKLQDMTMNWENRETLSLLPPGGGAIDQYIYPWIYRPKKFPSPQGGGGKFAEDTLKKSANVLWTPTHPISLLFGKKSRYIFHNPPLKFP